MQRLLQHAGRSARSAARCSNASRSATAAYATQGQTGQTPQDTIEVFVNGVSTQVAKGSTVIQACDAAGIDIPRCERCLCLMPFNGTRAAAVLATLVSSAAGCCSRSALR